MPLFSNFSPEEIKFNDGFGDITLKELGPVKWQLLNPVDYTTIKGVKINVPTGFITDGASSPLRILLTSLGGHYTTAAIIHDWLYTNLNEGHPIPGVETREDADSVLLEAMERARPEVNYWVRWAIWMIVRGFGGPGFKALGVR